MRIHCEAEKAEMIRTCRRELREITQNPVYFTRSGRVWHSDPRCPSRFTDQSIQSRGYCTLCAHFLGREVPEHEFEAGGPVTEAPLVWFFLHRPLLHWCELSATQLCIQPFLSPFTICPLGPIFQGANRLGIHPWALRLWLCSWWPCDKKAIRAYLDN